MTGFDYVIVGAGSAGCVLAEKLSADSRHNVLLVEAGERHNAFLDNLFIEMPMGFSRTVGAEKFSWLYPTEPENATGYPGEVWVRGKALGGSSAINGLVYNRGQPGDYDALAALGCTDWNWDSMLPYFRGVENHSLGASEWRGHRGPMRVSVPGASNAFNAAMIDACTALGLKPLDDINTLHGDGAVGPTPHNIYRGRRWSSVRAFLTQAQSRRNFSIVTETEVTRIVFEGARAIGVQCSGKSCGYFAARREVILCAGAIASPRILLLSGIGPAAELQSHGIQIIADSPQVGNNLREHRTLFMRFRLRDASLSQNRQFHGLRLYLNIFRYLLVKTGALGAHPFPSIAFFRALPESPRPDVQALFIPYTIDITKLPVSTEREPGISWIAQPLRPTSAGTIRLRSADHSVPLDIRPNYLSTEHDRRVAVGAVKFLRRLARQPPLREAIGHETSPGSDLRSDEQILDAWHRLGTCGWHACGTCRMGSDPQAVVDPSLRVNGVRHLRVVDASVFPQIMSGNTHAPVVALAARAADIILAGSQNRVESSQSFIS